MAITSVTLIAICCLLSVTLANANSRILGGDETSTGQYPWVTSVRVKNTHACVGSIISASHILTAAHCVSELGSTSVDVSTVTVRVGSINQFAGGKIVKVRAINIHPSYGNFLHDVAILTLENALTFTENIRHIEIADADDELEQEAAVSVTGWGLAETGASPYKLQQSTLSILSSSECEYQAGYGYESVLCLAHPAGKGTCRGDDGAGVFTNNKLYGIVSFAFGTCGTVYPDIASKVAYYHEWIQAVIA